MTEQHSRDGQERRLRRAAVTAANQLRPEPSQEPEDDSAAAQRMERQTLWVDLQLRRAMARGDFDNLPGAGKPIPELGDSHDPNWWVKQLIEREQITGVLPPALALRKEAAELTARLERQTTEQGVRRVVADFNQRVVEARRQLLGGPPVVTATRDADAEVAGWRSRLAARREQLRRQRESALRPVLPASNGRRWGRLRRGRQSRAD
ncbi:MAG: DUF1992 domain-containing protein [Nocardioidaceae bacterium]|nr:DUF1992 domain-containing protein [Nocardioidaceae bacterium]